MRIVLITGDNQEHRYVTNRIVDTHEVEAVLVTTPAPRRDWKKTMLSSPIRFLDKALGKIYLSVIKDSSRRNAALHSVLGRESENFSRPEMLRSAGPTKGPLLEQIVSELRPDIIAVYGTAVIPDSVLRLANVLALNMHTGLSPWYRGTRCSFWPIVDGKPEMVGATVHECTAELDGGMIFFRERTPIYRGDDLHTIFARAVKTGADGYVDVIERALKEELEGIPQDLSLGQEYRGSMVGLRSELAARIALRRMTKDLPPVPQY